MIWALILTYQFIHLDNSGIHSVSSLAYLLGLGIVGIVLTLFLQYEQFRLQHGNYRDWKKHQEENKDALNTQRREQFLAARLNATIALLQGYGNQS